MVVLSSVISDDGFGVHRLNVLLKIKQCKLQLQREMPYCSVCIRYLRMYSIILWLTPLLAVVRQTLLTGKPSQPDLMFKHSVVLPANLSIDALAGCLYSLMPCHIASLAKISVFATVHRSSSVQYADPMLRRMEQADAKLRALYSPS